MTAREFVGLGLLILGAVVVPLGWIVSHKILLLAAVFMGIGAWLFYTARIFKRAEQLAKESTRNYGPPMPGDVHNYTGWRTGGRTQPLDTSSSEGGSDGH